eukprot:TRINITY_DN5780_c0_g1_i6.p1 TRINITY_DN5780_c0_g1~~TRINITY_DN5780_c0_g1_i6.p1  ORF type:complete len:478 (+),score=94.89 TRINITY_DN5780_c0_g1_i6:555-1988(+)
MEIYTNKSLEEPRTLIPKPYDKVELCSSCSIDLKLRSGLESGKESVGLTSEGVMSPAESGNEAVKTENSKSMQRAQKQKVIEIDVIEASTDDIPISRDNTARNAESLVVKDSEEKLADSRNSESNLGYKSKKSIRIVIEDIESTNFASAILEGEEMSNNEQSREMDDAEYKSAKTDRRLHEEIKAMSKDDLECERDVKVSSFENCLEEEYKTNGGANQNFDIDKNSAKSAAMDSEANNHNEIKEYNTESYRTESKSYYTDQELDNVPKEEISTKGNKKVYINSEGGLKLNAKIKHSRKLDISERKCLQNKARNAKFRNVTNNPQQAAESPALKSKHKKGKNILKNSKFLTKPKNSSRSNTKAYHSNSKYKENESIFNKRHLNSLMLLSSNEQSPNARKEIESMLNVCLSIKSREETAECFRSVTSIRSSRKRPAKSSDGKRDKAIERYLKKVMKREVHNADTPSFGGASGKQSFSFF